MVCGFVSGDAAYFLLPNRQYQVKLTEFRNRTAIAIPMLMRTKETIDGIPTGVWNKWSPTNHAPFQVNLMDCVKSVS